MFAMNSLMLVREAGFQNTVKFLFISKNISLCIAKILAKVHLEQEVIINKSMAYNNLTK